MSTIVDRNIIAGICPSVKRKNAKSVDFFAAPVLQHRPTGPGHFYAEIAVPFTGAKALDPPLKIVRGHPFPIRQHAGYCIRLCPTVPILLHQVSGGQAGRFRAALLLLVFIGGKMLYEGLTPCECDSENGICRCDKRLALPALLVQGVATSIDALSVGLTISDLGFAEALLESSIIAALTLGICFAGIEIGKRFGTKLADKAAILGGSVLIAIGFKIFFFG